MNKSVAVLDLGTARSKLTVVNTAGSQEHVRLEKWETGLNTTDDSASIGADASRLLEVVESVKSVLRAEGAALVKVVATEAFRKSPGLRRLLPLLEGALGVGINVLTPEVEASLFWSGVSDVVCPLESCVAADIGGGSVQVVWGSTFDAFLSRPVGTFALERELQTSKEVLSEQDASRMRAHVANAFQSLGSSAPKGLPLVVGSSVMAQFFASALDHFGIPRESAVPGHISAAAVRKLADRLIGLPYEKAQSAYMANKGFMFGADKALVVITVLIALLDTKSVIPTDESLASALARAALRR